MADSASLPSKGILLEQLVLSTVHTVLGEPGRMSGLGLDLDVSFLLGPGLFLRDRLRQALKIFLRELELSHGDP
jgi:hypothetical protein